MCGKETIHLTPTHTCHRYPSPYRRECQRLQLCFHYGLDFESQHLLIFMHNNELIHYRNKTLASISNKQSPLRGEPPNVSESFRVTNTKNWCAQVPWCFVGCPEPVQWFRMSINPSHHLLPSSFSNEFFIR